MIVPKNTPTLWMLAVGLSVFLIVTSSILSPNTAATSTTFIRDHLFFGLRRSSTTRGFSSPSSQRNSSNSHPEGGSTEMGSKGSSDGSNKPVSGSCDLYSGKWVHDPAWPLYTNNSCPIISQHQNCQGNGRPDRDYENWRWKPHRCHLPRFNATQFLEITRGKSIAFVGDSVARNQMESLVCILWQVEVPKKRGKRGMQRWFFPSTSTWIIRIWSSWLVHRTSDAMEYAPAGLDKVYLDKADETFMQHLPSFDVIVLSSGHWMVKRSAYVLGGEIVGGQGWQPPRREDGRKMPEMDNVEAYGITVETALSAISTHPNYTGLAILRTFSPDHYGGGGWNTGGSCAGKTRPLAKVARSGFTDAMHAKQVRAFGRVAAKVATKGDGPRLKLMDVTEMFGYRHDGHPGPYRNSDPGKKTEKGPDGKPPPQDCLHWCTPGPVDTWNEILMETIRREYLYGDGET